MSGLISSTEIEYMMLSLSENNIALGHYDLSN